MNEPVVGLQFSGKFWVEAEFCTEKAPNVVLGIMRCHEETTEGGI